MVYDLPLVDEKVKPHQVTTLHLICAFAFIGTGAIITVYNYTIPMWGGVLLALGVLLLGATIFKNSWVTHKKVNLGLRIAELVVGAVIAIYSTTQHWKFPIGMFAALCAGLLFAIYWERKSADTLYVHVDDNGLLMPVMRRKFLPWVEVENVVMRFGTLTINTADNHFFQWNIVVSTDHDAEIFEAFCSAKIEEYRGKRRNDDW